MNSTARANLNQPRAAATRGFAPRLNWLINHALVAEGLPDSWHVRLDGNFLDGYRTLHQLSQIHSANPATVLEVGNAESDASGQWIQIVPDARVLFVLRLILACINAAAGASLGAYVFNGNHGNSAQRLAWSGAVGLTGAILFQVTSRYLLGSFAWFLHLLGDHTKAFLRGGVLGAACGVIAELCLWNSSLGVQNGLLIAILVGLVTGFLAGTACAQAHHDRCVQTLVGAQDVDCAAPPCANSLPPQPGLMAESAFPGIAVPYRALLTALFITIVTAQIPRQAFGTDGDASWSGVLNYAHEHGWQFGTDIVYTYGPLGFLTSHHYSSSAAALQLVIKTGLAFLVALGVCLLAWRLPLLFKWLLLGLFTFFSAAIHIQGSPYAATDLSFYVGLLCWGLLCCVESRPRLIVCWFCFVSLAVLATLVKVSFILPAVIGIGSIAGVLMAHRSRRLGIVMIVGYGLSLFVGWIATGQKLANFGLFLRHGFEITNGYHDAMCYGMNRQVTWTAILTASLALAAVLLPLLRPRGRFGHMHAWRRLLICAWPCSLFFVVWKYGMIRSGQSHLEIFIGFMPVLALSMMLLADHDYKRTAWAGSLALACSLMSLILLDTTFYRGFASLCLCEPFSLLRWNAHWLLKPTEYWSAKAIAAPLPKINRIVGQSSVDVFGCEQAFALLNGLNYRPRPVFQSLAAYSTPLDRLNEQFYLSKSAPNYVMFDLSPLDWRFPPLEDSMVLRHLLINYEPVEAEGRFLLLRSRAHEPPELKLLSEGTASPGQRISLVSAGDANLWMEVNVQPTPAGWLLRYLYKFPPVRLCVWADPALSRPVAYEAPRPMLSAGFVASPLLLNMKDIENLYSGVKPARPTAYSVEFAPGTQRFWKDAIHFRIYRIENGLGHRSP